MITITKEQFDEYMEKADKCSEIIETYAGIENAVQDGDTYEQYNSSEKECEDMLAYADLTRVELCSQLGVPMQFLVDILDSCIINRWEMYQFIKRSL